MKPVAEQHWETYSYRTQEGIAWVLFWTGANQVEQARYPFCARVRIPIREPDVRGRPQTAEAAILDAMEDELFADLQREKAGSLLVGRVTLAGVRELVFQVAGWDTFRPPVGRWMGRHPDREFDVWEEDGWEFFQQSLWPTPEDWLLIADRKVVDGLLASGSNPEAPHCLEFCFRGPVGALGRLREQLASRGYQLVELKPGEQRLVMSLSLPLDLARIVDESRAHRESCRSLGLDYDGWGALVVR